MIKKTIRKIITFIRFIIFCYGYKLTNRTFILDGKKFSYFYHPHGSWANERCVEVAIGLSYLKEYKPVDVLEVGNVISMYQPVFHTVVDKYDKQTGVINEDVVDFDTTKRFKLIFSISTLEHVGFDETTGIRLNDIDKVQDSVDNLKRLLTDDGLLVVTMPIGYRDSLDDKIYNNDFGFSSISLFRRVSWSNRWIETFMPYLSFEEFKSIHFDSPFPKANGLFVGVYQKC